LLFAGIGLFVATYLVFYPPVFAIVDEDAYLSQALLLRTGRVTYALGPDEAPHMSTGVPGRMASKYPPGNRLFLVPFTLPGWRFVFVSGLVLAVAGTLLFWRVLRRLAPESDPAWALAWLFYPSVVIYSRTVMSDLFCATLTLAAFYFLLRAGRWTLAAGLAFGFSFLTRYSNAVLFPVFVLLAQTGGPGRLRRAALFMLGFAPFVALALGYNRLCYGGPLAFPMHLTTVFSPAFVPRNLVLYGSSLLVAWPLALAAPLAAGRRLLLWLGLPAAALFIFYCFVPHPTPGLDFVGRTVVGLRYLLPAAPFLLLAWCAVLDRLSRPLLFAAALRVLLVVLFAASSVVLQWRHQQALKEQDSCRRALLSMVPEGAYVLANAAAAELLSPAWGTRPHRLYVEHGVPVEFARPAPEAETVYAVFRKLPGRDQSAEWVVFERLRVCRGGEAAGVQGCRLPGRGAGRAGSGCGLVVGRLKP